MRKFITALLVGHFSLGCYAAKRVIPSPSASIQAAIEAAEAIRSLRKGKIEAALVSLQEFLSIHPDHPYAAAVTLAIVEGNLRADRSSVAKATLDYFDRRFPDSLFKADAEQARVLIEHFESPSVQTRRKIARVAASTGHTPFQEMCEALVFR